MAGTITQAWHTTGTVKKVIFTCTADSSDGSYPDTVLSKPIDGYLLALETNPGATGPTANYDITIENDNAVDVLAGAGANRHTSDTEVAYPAVGMYFKRPIAPSDTLTLKIANNSVNSAVTVITLFWSASG